MPQVSVIIPTYNYGRFLGDAVTSVLGQTFRDLELIVVDDGSTDNTREVVSRFPDVRMRYIYQSNQGVSSAQNTGIDASRGEYVAILGADDVWLPHKLERQIPFLNSRPDLAAVCSDAYIVDAGTGAVTGRYWDNSRFLGPFDPAMSPRAAFRRLLCRGCFIHNSTAVVRRAVFEKVGLYDESLRTHEVWDMWVRVLLAFDVGMIDEPLAKYRRHNSSLSGDWHQMYEDGVTVLTKAMNTLPLSKNDLVLLSKRLARHHFAYGSGLVLNDNISVGRQKLIASIRMNPWAARPYLYLAGSLVGSKSILSLKSWKKGAERRLGRGVS